MNKKIFIFIFLLIAQHAFSDTYPKNPNSYMTRGRALSEMGRADEAYALLQQGRKVIANNEHIGYLTIVAGFEAGRPVCEGELATMMAEFSTSGRLRMLNAHKHLNPPSAIHRE